MDPSTSAFAMRLYMVTFVTAALALVAAFYAAVEDYQHKRRPSTGRIVSAVLFIITALCALPYMWSKKLARIKFFMFLIGWSLVLVMQLIGLEHTM